MYEKHLKIQFDKIRQDNKYKELMDALERGINVIPNRRNAEGPIT